MTEQLENSKSPSEHESSRLMFCITRKHVQQFCTDHNEEQLTSDQMTKLFDIMYGDRNEIIDNAMYRMYGLDQA